MFALEPDQDETHYGDQDILRYIFLLNSISTLVSTSVDVTRLSLL